MARIPNAERRIREAICEIGRRLYARGFVAGTDGNISCRLSRRVVVCTPTLVSKGFMVPTDLCTVDLAGRQLSGKRRPTSELGMHLEIYRGDPRAQAVVHAHPPHATAFAVTHRPIPTGILPEIEVFLGVVPLARYATPGTAELAASIRRYVGKANTILLSNHGTVSWAESLERACWNTEMLDAYCRILILAKSLGRVRPLPAESLAVLRRLNQDLRG